MLPSEMQEELICGLREIFQEDISKIILYGSTARGEETTESDVDIAIIMKNAMDDEKKGKFISWSANMDIRYGRVFSIIDIQEDKIKRWGKVLPFYKNVQQEGIVLWKEA